MRRGSRTGRPPPRNWRGGAASSPRRFGDGTPETRQGARAGAARRAVQPAARGVRGAHRRRRDGSRPAPLRDLRRSLRVLHPRRVGGRAHLPRDLRLRGSAVRVSTRSTSASRSSSRTSSATSPAISRSGRVYIPREDLRAPWVHGSGPGAGISAKPAAACARRRSRRSSASRGIARATTTGAPREALPRRDAKRLAAAEIMGAIYRAHPRSHRARGLRRVHPRRPDSAAAARADRGGHVGADGHRRAGQGRPGRQSRQAMTGRAGRRRDRRRLRGAERGRGARRARRARAGAGCAAAARRPGHGFHRSRDRRARRQRPARALRLLPRDVRVPGDGSRRSTTCASSRRWKWPTSMPRAADRCSAARRCPLRCTCSPPCSTGTRSRGAIAWPR